MNKCVMAVLEIVEDRHFCVKKYCDFVKKHLTQNINQHIIARYDIRRNSMHQSPGVC